MTSAKDRADAREALRSYMAHLQATKGLSKEDARREAEYWVQRVTQGLPAAEAFTVAEAAKRAEADQRHTELMRRLKDSDTR